MAAADVGLGRWTWALLALAVCAVSSAAPVLRTMAAVQPLLRASWRQQLTAALVLPPALAQFRSLDAELRARLRRREVVLTLVGSGLLLAAHFGLWIWSIDHTTLAHSVLLVSANPILLALGRAALRLPIHLAGELGGAVLGFSGVAVSLAGELCAAQLPPPLAAFERAGAGPPAESVQLAGDLAALGGAAAFVLYLLIGREVRQWLPTFLYVAPVFAVSALALTAAAAAYEGATLGGGLSGSAAGPGAAERSAALATFGWASLEWAPSALYLAVGPGVCGHAVLNLCVGHLDPLVISVALLAEPLLATALGCAMGVSALPGPWTLGGGPLLLAGCALTVWGAHTRDRARAGGDAAGGATGAAHARSSLGRALERTALRLRGAQRLADDDAQHMGGGVGSVDDVAEDLWGAGAGPMVGGGRKGAPAVWVEGVPAVGAGGRPLGPPAGAGGAGPGARSGHGGLRAGRGACGGCAALRRSECEMAAVAMAVAEAEADADGLNRGVGVGAASPAAAEPAGARPGSSSEAASPPVWPGG